MRGRPFAKIGNRDARLPRALHVQSHTRRVRRLRRECRLDVQDAALLGADVQRQLAAMRRVVRGRAQLVGHFLEREAPPEEDP